VKPQTFYFFSEPAVGVSRALKRPSEKTTGVSRSLDGLERKIQKKKK